jgi:plastocyanin
MRNASTTSTALRSPVRRFALAVAITAATLAGCGGEDGPDVSRSYDVDLRVDDSEDTYRYVATGEIPDFTVGDEVTFVVDNTGQFSHDLQVVAPDGDVLGVADPVAPGETLELTVFLGQVGVYRLNCLFDNHLTEHDMQTLIEVGPAEV